MNTDFQKSDVDHGPHTKNELPFLKPLREYWNKVKKESNFFCGDCHTHFLFTLYDAYLWCLLNDVGSKPALH